jgi:hypothetical protein
LSRDLRRSAWTARRLKPGAFDAFREAFEKADIEDVPPAIVKRRSRVCVCRDVTDETWP